MPNCSTVKREYKEQGVKFLQYSPEKEGNSSQIGVQSGGLLANILVKFFYTVLTPSQFE